MNALADLEKATGMDLADICARLNKTPSITLLRGCLWAGLRHEDAKLTLDQAGNLITMSNMAELWAKCLEALIDGLGGPSAASPLADSPGTNSGPSPATISG